MSDQGIGARSRRELLLRTLAGGAAIAAFFVAFAVIMFLFVPNGSDRANFGSMFGAPGALFGAVALLGVLWALKLQQEAAERDKVRLSRDQEQFYKTMRLNALVALGPWIEEQLKRHEERETLGTDAGVAMTRFRNQVFLEIESLSGFAGPLSEEAARERERAVEALKPGSESFEF